MKSPRSRRGRPESDNDPHGLRSLRRKLGMTQFEMARLIDVRRDTLAKWEAGVRRSATGAPLSMNPYRKAAILDVVHSELERREKDVQKPRMP